MNTVINKKSFVLQRQTIEGLFVIGLLLVFLFLSRSDFLSASSIQWLTDIAWVVFCLLATVRCYQAGLKCRGNLRKGWFFFTLAHAAWLAGIMIWSYLELVEKQAVPFPEFSDLGFMAFAPLSLLGFYHFRDENREEKNTLLQLSKVMVIIACLVVLHVYLLATPLRENQGDTLYVSVALAYPVLYMTTLIYAVLSFIKLNKNVSSLVFGFILASFCLHAFTDSLYAYSLLGSSYQVGSYLDIYWLAAFASAYTAASLSMTGTSKSNERKQLKLVIFLNNMIVPVLLLLVLCVVLINTQVWQQQNKILYLYSLGFLVACLAFYQVMVARLEGVLVENLSISEDLLKKSNRELISLANSSSVQLADEVNRHRATGEQLAEHHRLLDIIRQVQEDYISGLYAENFYDKLLNSAVDVTGSQYGFIGNVFYQEGQPYLKTLAISNISDDEDIKAFYENSAPPGMEFYNTNNLFGCVMKNREVVISNDVKNDSRAGQLPEGHPPVNAFMGIPLMHKGNIIGMVGVANRKDGYTYPLVRHWAPFFQTCCHLMLANKVEQERRLAEEELLQAKDDAERANMAKSEFMSRMSHELRTPLNAVMGFSQLLNIDENLSAQHRDSVEEIIKAGSHLLNLINDLLDISRIEINQVQYHFEIISLKNLLEEAISMTQALAVERRVEINLEVKSDVMIKADPQRIRQVIINLMSNAIKYNKPGGQVDIMIAPDDDEEHCQVAITDTGIGIAADKLPRLFTPFDRLEVEKYAVDGVGIGLYLSWQIVASHHGEIRVESQEGKGSTFTLRLPLSA